jgi:hypothetical protein
MRVALTLAWAGCIALLALLAEVCLGAEVAHVDVPIEENAPPANGHPLTSVVVTQCNLIVAVYVTMPDGRLQRFDKSSGVSAEQLLEMAYTAVRSERLEVECFEDEPARYERHDPV